MTAEERGWWWLSFADPGEGSLGVAIVRARDDIVSAALRAHELGINPGGEVLGMEFDEQMWRDLGSDLELAERFLTPDEAERVVEGDQGGEI